MAVEAMGKLADDFIDGFYSDQKPKSLEEYSNWHYKSAQMGSVFGYRNFTWTASDGGITRAKRTQNKPLGVQYEMQYMTPVLGHTTDLHMCVAENQSRRCGGMELRALECIEYYGRQKGFVICKDLYEDFMECKYNSVQKARWMAMHREYRKRQWQNLRGQLPEEQQYDGWATKPPPPAWAFQDPLATQKNQPVPDFLDD